MERDDCKQCSEPYVQVFTTRPMRPLWWVDEHLHRLHVPWWVQRWTCNAVERRLWSEDVPDAAISEGAVDSA